MSKQAIGASVLFGGDARDHHAVIKAGALLTAAEKLAIAKHNRAFTILGATPLPDGKTGYELRIMLAGDQVERTLRVTRKSQQALCERIVALTSDGSVLSNLSLHHDGTTAQQAYSDGSGRMTTPQPYFSIVPVAAG